MPLTRRSFLRSGSLAAFAAAFALGPRLTAFGRSSGDAGLAGASATLPSPAGLTREAFEPYVGGIFRGQSGHRPVDLTLHRVDGYEPGAGTRIAQARSRATDTFTLTFGADRALSPNSAVHTLEHGSLGKFDLFMIGTPLDGGRFIYQAVISRLV
jgi:hypothetical protein